MVRVNWVWSQLLFLMVLPCLLPILLVALVLPGQIGIWVLGFGVAVGVLLILVITGFMVAALLSQRFFAGSLWSGLENRLIKVVQLEPPLTDRNEEIFYSNVEQRPLLLPNRGRLLLTPRRLLYQRPRFSFLWPKKPGRLLEIPLVDVAGVEIDRSLLRMMLRNPQVSRRLRIRLKDGRRIDFHSPVATRWRRYINRALAAQQQNG